MNEAQKIIGTITLPLSAPIQAHKDELTELTIRRPTPKECRSIGAMPYTIDGEGMPKADPVAASEYIVLCAGIPMSSVDQLALPDFNKALWLVIGFFVKSGAEASAS